MPPQALPALPHVSLTNLFDPLDVPTTRIKFDEDVNTWKTTRGYQNYILFLRRLNESVVGFDLTTTENENLSPAVCACIALLDQLDAWIDEIPPLDTPQRFGNRAFRTWGKKLEDHASGLLEALLPTTLRIFAPQLLPYLVISFGSFGRMDYGTGHEAAFGLFLLCLTLVRFFEPVPEVERQMVLNIFERYLRLCWRLQDQYNLEPAGSQGVWGLDDYGFLGYIFGSGQLRDQADVAVSSILQTNLPPSNLYNVSISRIRQVKQGPFYEHSSQLHSIAMGVPNWGKVNSGLFKMYEAEVLGKRVVVQHLPLGGLVEWDFKMNTKSTLPPTKFVGTKAPWVAAPIPSVAMAAPSSVILPPRTNFLKNIRPTDLPASQVGSLSVHLRQGYGDDGSLPQGSRIGPSPPTEK